MSAQVFTDAWHSAAIVDRDHKWVATAATIPLRDEIIAAINQRADLIAQRDALKDALESARLAMLGAHAMASAAWLNASRETLRDAGHIHMETLHQTIATADCALAIPNPEDQP